MQRFTLKKQLSYQGKKVDYILKIRDQKNLILRLEENQIVVSSPPMAQDWEIENFIYKHIKKIENFIEFQERNRLYELSGPNKFVKIWGEKVPFIYEHEINNIKETNLLVFKAYEDEKETILKMYNVLKKMYELSFIQRMNYWTEMMGLTFKNLSIKIFKGRWGVCYPELSKILLNIKLIHYPTVCLDYVCVHELSHLVHSNHSKDFWHFVEKYLPDYKMKSDLLKVVEV